MSLRFRYRHVHQTVADYIIEALEALGWGNAGKAHDDPINLVVNFETDPATYVTFQPDEAGKPIVANTIAITLGDEPAADDNEMGSTLRTVQFPVFVDIYGANQSIAQSIASDVKRLFEDRYLLVKDYTADAISTAEQVEFDKDDVDITKPIASVGATDFKRYWRVVKTTARVTYLED